jgi:hypothetical protein
MATPNGVAIFVGLCSGLVATVGADRVTTNPVLTNRASNTPFRYTEPKETRLDYPKMRSAAVMPLSTAPSR